MLKAQLIEIARQLVRIPEHYQLFIEDYSNEEAQFIWKGEELVDSIGITLNQNGQLISLTKPATINGKWVSIEEQQLLAEHFLTAQYPDALNYYTLTSVKEKDKETKFFYEQYVGGYPLASYYCVIVVSQYGEIIDFSYYGYTTNPPKAPATITPEDSIRKHLYVAKWNLNLHYLSKEIYSVPESGLYLMYTSPIVYWTFDAGSGQPMVEYDEHEESDFFIPFPQIKIGQRHTTIEGIIGVPDSMEIVREIELDEPKIGIVWREKSWQAPTDKSLESYFMSRIDDSVKADIDTKTNHLKSFIWFKERIGNLDLSFEECREVACRFIATYFPAYVPYLEVKIKKPSFNEVHRAFFTFPLNVGGYRMDDLFYVTVNKTTGFIDMLRSPKIQVATLEAYKHSEIVSLEEAKEALKDVGALLQWKRNYNEDDHSNEVLQYTFGHIETKQRIEGIDAVTGKLVVNCF